MVNNLSIDRALKLGVEAHRTGDARTADKYYTAILSEYPDNAPANHNMGLLAHHLGHSATGLKYLEKALSLEPENKTFLDSYLTVSKDTSLNAFCFLQNKIKATLLVDTAEYLGLSLLNQDYEHLLVDRTLGEKSTAEDRKQILTHLCKLFNKLPTVKNSEAKKSLIEACNVYGLQPILLEGFACLEGIKKHADLKHSHKVVLNDYYNAKNYRKCLATCKKFIKEGYYCIFLYNLIANCHHALRQNNEAFYNYCVALSFDIDETLVLNNFAKLNAELKSWGQSKHAYIRLISSNDSNQLFYRGLGHCHFNTNNFVSAVGCFTRALLIEPKSKLDEHNFYASLLRIDGPLDFPELRTLLSKILDNENVIPNFFKVSSIAATMVVSELRRAGMLHRNFQLNIDQLESLNANTLLISLLKVNVTQNLEFEDFIINVRREILKSLTGNENLDRIADLINAIGVQIWLNESIFTISSQEVVMVTALRDELSHLSALQSDADFLKYVVLKCYDPSFTIPHRGTIRFSSIYYFDYFSKDLLHTQESLPSYFSHGQTVSDAVRSMYEQNPYPRWVKLPGAVDNDKSSSIGGLLESFGALFSATKSTTSQNPKVLVAGCGTGRHPLDLANRLPTSDVTAIDLSMSSLSYGALFSRVNSIENVEFFHCDLLEVDQHFKSFDLIECSGVLHHMEDPVAGWKKLVGRLRSGGVMKIGLYSEIARSHELNDIREIAKQEIGLDASLEDIRNFREKLKSSDSFKDFFSVWGDCYSTSEFRDLVLHVQEHQFTISKIEDLLRELSLKFICMTNLRLPNYSLDQVSKLSLKDFTYLENENPLLFSGMYQFYCQKL